MEKKDNSAISLNFGFRGWMVIIYCFIAFLVGGAFLGVWQITVTANVASLGWNSTAIFSLTQVAGVLMCLMELFISKLMMKNKVNLSLLGTIMALIFAIGCIVMRFFMTNVIFFNLFFVIAYIMINAQSLCLNGSLVGNWWPKRRGMVIGITTIGVPVGSAFGTGMYNLFANLFGMNNVLVVYAVIGLIVFLIGAFLVRDYPEQVGCYPDNDKNESREQLEAEFEAMRKAQPRNAWNMKRILSTRYSWLIMAVALVCMLANGIYMMQSMNRLTVVGDLELQQAMTLMTTAAVVACFGSPLCGVIDGKFGSKKFGIILMIMTIVCTLFQIPGTYTSTLIGMIIFGVLMGGGSNILVTLCSDSWPRESSSRAFSVMQPSMHLCQTIISEIILLIASAIGTYVPIYIAYAVFAVIVMIIFALRYDAKNIRDLDAKYKAADEAAGVVIE